MKKLIFILFVFVAISIKATVYHVAATGGDFATIAAVNAHGNFSAGDQILFNKGETFYGTLDLKGSGTAGNVITYGAYGTGAAPILTGFSTITGWTNEGGGIYSKVITPESAVQVVLIDGVQYAMGRYPNSSYLMFESASTNVSITDNSGFGASNWIGSEAVIHKNGYTIDRCTITNQVSNTLTYTSLGTTRNAEAPNSYFFQNSINVLDQYGEWYYNTGTGKLSIYFDGVNPATKTIKVATLDYIIYDLTDEDYVTIDGLQIEGAIKNAIHIGGTNTDITVQNNTIKYAGGHSIYINNATSGTSNSPAIINNIISDCAYGLRINGDNLSLTSNTFERIGIKEGIAYQMVYSIVAYVDGDNPSMTYNNLDYCAYSGLYMTVLAVTGTIQYNIIDHPCQLILDAGGIYMGHDHPSTLVDNNIVLNSGGNGIYLDEYCTGVTCTDNTIAHSADNGIKLHKASSNTLTGNLCFDNLNAFTFTNFLNENNIHNNVVTGNTFVAKSGQYVMELITRYTGSWDLGTLNNNYYSRPTNENLSFSTNLPAVGFATKTFSQWKTLTGEDAASSQSPQSLVSDSDIQFEYNATTSPINKGLVYPSIDMAGTKFVGTKSVGAYSSFVVLKDANPTPPPAGLTKFGKIGSKWGFIGGHIGGK